VCRVREPTLPRFGQYHAMTWPVSTAQDFVRPVWPLDEAGASTRILVNYVPESRTPILAIPDAASPWSGFSLRPCAGVYPEIPAKPV